MSKSHIASLLALAALPSLALAGDMNGAGLLVLNASADSALSMSGNSRIVVPANAVIVNSSSTRAVRTVGEASLDTPNLYIVGGASFGGNSDCTGTIQQISTPAPDPCAGLVFPTTEGLPNRGSVSINSNSTVTLQPGRYAELTVTGNATITFAPGVYVFQGNLRITSGRVTGTEVCIVMLSGSLDIAGTSGLNLTPPSSGSLRNMVIAQARTNTSLMSLAGGSEVSIVGTIYSPAGQISLAGNSTLEGTGPQMGDSVICNTVRLVGTGAIKVGRPAMPAMQLPSPPLFD